MEQYLAQLCVRFADGRAAVAQQLHILHPKGAAAASLGVGDLSAGLPRATGAHAADRASASLVAGDPATGLTRVVGGPGTRNAHSSTMIAQDSCAGGATQRNGRNAEERCVDSWAMAGTGGRWVRTHRTPRRALFTPHRVAGGPGREVHLLKTRVTTGKFLNTGEEFRSEDRYTDPRAAHLMLEHAWVGTSEFLEEPRVELNKVSSSWADWASEDDEEKSNFAGASVPRRELHRPSLSLIARAYPQVTGQLSSLAGRSGVTRVDRPCAESALSPVARASDWIDGGRKLKSCDSRRGSYATGSLCLVSRLSYCPEPILSPAISLVASSSEAHEIVGEGECQTGTGISRDIGTGRPRGKAHTRMTLQMVKRAECHQIGIWLKAKLKLKSLVSPLLALGSQR